MPTNKRMVKWDPSPRILQISFTCVFVKQTATYNRFASGNYRDTFLKYLLINKKRNEIVIRFSFTIIKDCDDTTTVKSNSRTIDKT